LIFYPKDKKEGVNFEGDRTLEPLKKWLEENSPVLKAAKEGEKGKTDEL
jgi:hypothetical protein